MTHVPKRFVIAFLAFLSYGCMSLMDTNSRNTIIFMTTYEENKLTKIDGIDYDLQYLDALDHKGRIASYLGAGCSIVAGIVAMKCGGVTAFGMGTGMNAISNILLPIALATNAKLFILCRFIRTFAHALSIVAMSDVWSKWSPAAERSTLYTVSYVGLSTSMLIYNKFSNFITSNIGVLIFAGIIAIIVTIIWIYLVKNHPDDDETLSSHERSLLADRLEHVIKKRGQINEVPWKNMVFSGPVWGLGIVAIFNSHLMFTYSYEFLTEQNKIDDITKQTVKGAANLSNIPSLLVAGYLADLLKNEFDYEDTVIRKIYICSAYTIGAFLMLIFSSSWDLIPFIVFFSAVELTRVVMDVAVLINAIDIAPQYASLLSGIYWSVYTIGALLNSSFIGNVVERSDITDWEFCFVIYITLYIVSAFLYYILGSGKVQPWNKPQIKKNEIELNV